jgi:glutathione synthase/RimK-type ligase-like ATP-grasp enzyme
MANIAIVNSKITSLNVNQVLTQTAANEDGAGVAQKFIYTPTGKDARICFVVYNKAAATIAATITAGARVFGAAAKVLTVPATALTTSIFQIETGKFMQTDGTVEVSFLPSGAGQLVTTHALTVGVIELQ